MIITKKKPKVVTILKLLFRPSEFLSRLGQRQLLNWMPDRLYLKIMYRGRTGKKLDLKNPQGYNEKLQWLKLYDRNPLYTQLVDKYEVRNYIKERVDERHLVKLYGVYEAFDEIDWDVLPESFILKCTQGCGCNHIVKNKNEIDKIVLRKKFSKWMKNNPYPSTREWPYKNVKPKIICEELLVDESGYELKDYKIFCFNGEPRFAYIASDRGIDTKFDYYDIEWNRQPLKQHYPNSNIEFSKPFQWEKMLDLSSKLSYGIPHVRVDLYLSASGDIYFGELTFFHHSGFVNFIPESYDYLLGSWIDLSLVECKYMNVK